MLEYLIGGFVFGIFAGMAIVNTWNYYWDTHGERPFAAQEDDLFRLIKANAEVANLNADLQDENMLLRDALEHCGYDPTDCIDCGGPPHNEWCRFWKLRDVVPILFALAGESELK